MPTDNAKTSLPLNGVRVLELASTKHGICGRLLADLGADVILIEPISGAPSRNTEPLHNDVSLPFAAQNANKRSVVLEIESETGRKHFLTLLQNSDILIDLGSAGNLSKMGLSPELLHKHNPQLVILAITDFGQTGPYRDFHATNADIMALAGVLCRSGIKNNYPLLPPGELAYETASIQAAWVALTAYWQATNTGQGDYLDFSIFEATAQILDPAMGVTGSAAGGQSALQLAPRGRPPVGTGYPIFPCADGYVRICVLNPRQWEGMSDWLGDSHEFTDPSYGKIGKRFKVIKQINLIIADLFREQTATNLVAEGQRRGVPIAAVATPRDVFLNPHFIARNTFTDLDITENITAKIPFGCVEIDGKQAGIRAPAPTVGQHTKEVLNSITSSNKDALNKTLPTPQTTSGIRRPYEGIRILDLGVIVAGAELGRLFADQGADVIKIENNRFPDGLRQSLTGSPMTISFAQGSRGKKSLGLNLRSERGVELFKQLVAESDIVLSNFKPGTMESLGFGYDVLKAINPKIIVADSSALGSSGPMSKSMGYGPLVRATSGLTWLWRYPELDDGFSDATTIFPDHFAARISATAIAAQLIRREQTGVGGVVSVCQAESILFTLSSSFLRESLQTNSFVPTGNHYEFDAPNGVYPCAGDDEWCTVSIRNNQDWQQLCLAIDQANLIDDSRFSTTQSRITHRSELDELVTQWTALKSPNAAMMALQKFNVPSGQMQRLDEYTQNPHFIARGFFKELTQPGLDEPLITENGPVSFSHLPEPQLTPAPFIGQHTEQIAAQILNLSSSEIQNLIESGDIEIASDEVKQLFAKTEL